MPKWPWFGLTPLIAKGNEEMWKSRMMQELRFFTSVDTQDVQKTWMDTWTLANTDMLVLDSPSPRKMLPDTSMYIKRHEACRRRAWQHGDWYNMKWHVRNWFELKLKKHTTVPTKERIAFVRLSESPTKTMLTVLGPTSPAEVLCLQPVGRLAEPSCFSPSVPILPKHSWWLVIRIRV